MPVLICRCAFGLPKGYRLFLVSFMTCIIGSMMSIDLELVVECTNLTS